MNTKQTEALKLALEALEDISALQNHSTGADSSDADKAITAIREALAEQPAQFPDFSSLFGNPDPQPAQQQEPFGHVTVRRLSQRFENHADQYWFFPAGQSPYRDNVDEIHAVYTSPPASKPWVGLSTDEIYDMYNEPRSDAEMVEFARAIEAKLREKNT